MVMLALWSSRPVHFDRILGQMTQMTWHHTLESHNDRNFLGEFWNGWKNLLWKMFGNWKNFDSLYSWRKKKISIETASIPFPVWRSLYSWHLQNKFGRLLHIESFSSFNTSYIFVDSSHVDAITKCRAHSFPHSRQSLTVNTLSVVTLIKTKMHKLKIIEILRKKFDKNWNDAMELTIERTNLQLWNRLLPVSNAQMNHHWVLSPQVDDFHRTFGKSLQN